MAPASVRNRAAALAVAALVAISCRGEGPLGRWSPQRSPHEAYAESLRSAGLHESAAGASWLARAADALAKPIEIQLPFQEDGYFDPSLPSAAGYRFSLPRGRALALDVRLESSRPTKLFIDLFRVTAEGAERVASAEEGRLDLRYVSRAEGSYVLRLQPELLGGGRYTIVQRSEATLRFPVQGVGERAIQSVFGDARDGGRRDHHGIDIFAPRGTPVLAGADGVVRRVDTTDIGGRVVWLSDTTAGQSLYYAHLNDWAVRQGQAVKAGDVLGYVGNTGNARSTPPHLHFGIYSGGPVDPLPFVRASDGTPSSPSAPAALIGQWGRLARGPAALRTALASRAAATTLPAATPLLLNAAASSSFRVTLPDGREGFVDAREVVSLDRPLRRQRAGDAAELREAPSAGAVVIQAVDAETQVAVFGEFDGFLLARLPDGRRGWMRGPSGSR